MPTESGSAGYLPALRFPALTRVYDPVVGLTTREQHFKEMLVEQAAPRAGRRILDLGCGTGTLAIQVKRRQPCAEVVGLDADPEMLEPGPGEGGESGCRARAHRGLLRRAALRGRQLRPGALDSLLPPPGSGAEAPHGARDRPCPSQGGRAARRRLGQALRIRRWPSRSSASGCSTASATPLDNYRGELPAIFEEAGLERARSRPSGSARSSEPSRSTAPSAEADRGRPRAPGPNRDGPGALRRLLAASLKLVLTTPTRKAGTCR